jgi:ATP-dependent helicase/nuclease subunit B
VWVYLARRLHPPAVFPPGPRREPTPPVAGRPRRLTVTEIEMLIRDPYAIYAKHILRLRKLDPIGKSPDAAERGTIVHEALGSFIGEWQGAFDERAEARLLDIGNRLLADIADFPDVHAVWSIRFRAIARWFIAFEAARTVLTATRHAEKDGKLILPDMPGGAFELGGRADRIDLLRDGSVAIFDFKTGTPQTEKTVFAGLTPQMTLEAAMVRAGAFGDELSGRSVAELAWLALGKVVRGEPYISAVGDNTADDLADRALEMLRQLIAAFDGADWPYRSRSRPMMERARYLGDYDHLARVREWSLVESEEDVAK